MNRDIFLQILQIFFNIVEVLLFLLGVLGIIICLGDYFGGENFVAIDFQIYELILFRTFIACAFVYVVLQITKLR